MNLSLLVFSSLPKMMNSFFGVTNGSPAEIKKYFDIGKQHIYHWFLEIERISGPESNPVPPATIIRSF